MNKYIDEVCKIGQGHACCRYLGYDQHGFVCFKNSTYNSVTTLAEKLAGNERKRSPKEIMDEAVAEGRAVARGDNCEGKDQEFLNRE